MARKQKAGKPKGKAPASPLPSDLEDDVDKFHKKRDKLSLNVEDDMLSDEDSMGGEDDAVLDVDQGTTDDDSDEFDTDDEIERKTHLGRREYSYSFESWPGRLSLGGPAPSQLTPTPT